MSLHLELSLVYRRCDCSCDWYAMGNVVFQTPLLKVNSGCLFSVFYCVLLAHTGTPIEQFLKYAFRSLAFQVPEMAGQANTLQSCVRKIWQ